MKIRLATLDDKEAWNEVAYNSPYSSYAHTWEWKTIIENGLGLESIALIAENNGKINGIYSGFLKKSATTNFMVKGRPILYSPLTVTWDYGGPCATSKKIAEKLLLAMHNEAKKVKAVSIRLSPMPNFDSSNLLSQNGYRTAKRETSFIDLNKSEDELWKDLNKKTRNQVRQSEKKGLKVREIKVVESFYKCLEDTAKRTGMDLPSRQFFEEIMKEFGSKNMAKIHIVESDDMVIGSSLCFYHKNYMVTRYYTALSDKLNLRPYHALIWNAIIDGKNNGIERCDLGGLPIDPNNGVRKFKMGWSGEIVNVDWYIKDIYLSGLRSLKRKMS